MTSLKDLGQRAQVCATCHVGGANAEVNHDLIAAGHPPLRFEFAAYLARMPRHGPADADRRRYPDFEARAWAVGQLVSARTDLELLAVQAQSTEKAWPEFAEYDCFACHHDLGRAGRQRPPGLGVRTLGAAPWGNWYYSMLPHVFALRSTEDSATIRSTLNALRQEMQKPLPDRGSVAKQAQKAIEQLSPWLARLSQGKYDDPVLLRQLLSSLETEDKPVALNWDAEGQRFLAMTALYQALRDHEPRQSEPKFRAYLQHLGGQLLFPSGYRSPREEKNP
jgi:hypothetical protein